MSIRWRNSAPWLAGAALLALAGAAAIVRLDIAERRDAFMADARIAHRLLSQQAVQHEAILGTLSLLSANASTDRPERRLIALYPQLVDVLRRDGDTTWPEASLAPAEIRSLRAKHAVLASVDAASRQFVVLLAGETSSFALRIDARRMVPADEWPLRVDGPVRVRLVDAAGTIELQPGAPDAARPRGLTAGFVFAKTLAAPGQPFELHLQRATGPSEWPWAQLVAWVLLCGAAGTLLAAWQHTRGQRERAEALLRIGRVARLNALGELAAGLAHELNQPLAAVLANTQAARRLLDERDERDERDEADLPTARHAITQATTQARRAADVLSRLRRQIEAPDAARPTEPVALHAAALRVQQLLQPEVDRLQVALEWRVEAPVIAQADPVALEQIVHNLIVNALQALAEVPAAERRLLLRVDRDRTHAVLVVHDSGPGLAPEILPRLFEPFATTRVGGLGLGLSLCRTLAQAMRGDLVARAATPRGAVFELTLPLASS